MGWNPRDICCRTRDFRSRDGVCRGLARRRQAPPLALTPGADRAPGLPALASSRTSSHATCPIASRFSCRLRSNVPSAWRGVGLLGHLSLAVWHFTLRFVLPWSWVGHPSATAAERRGWAMQSPSGPKVYPKCACVHAHGDAAADVNVVDGQRGATPAHLAAKGRHGEALKLVVAAGADVNPRPCWLSLCACHRVCDLSAMFVASLWDVHFTGMEKIKSKRDLLSHQKRPTWSRICGNLPRRPTQPTAPPALSL